MFVNWLIKKYIDDKLSIIDSFFFKILNLKINISISNYYVIKIVVLRIEILTVGHR